MSWIDFFSDIYVINLAKRTDRLIQITIDFEKYGIPFKRVEAIELPSGAEGLMETMKQIFREAIAEKKEHILIFEDDNEFVCGVDQFHLTMENVIAQLPENYIMIFLGCQVTGGATSFHSPNLVCGNQMFSTHAVMYSLQGMKEIMSRGFEYPIDNFYVAKIEKIGRSYFTYPLLCSQYAGFSDIGKNEISWKPFIEAKYQQVINELLSHG